MSIIDFSWVDGGYHNIFSTSCHNLLTFLFDDWLFWFSKLFLLISGYWGLYLVCVQLGNYLFFGKPGDDVLRTSDWARIRVWIICLLFWLLTVLLDRHVERVSHRMCNLAYVTVVLAMNLQVRFIEIGSVSKWLWTSSSALCSRMF
ncbi:hypothetical protein H5410_043130 [Solanum commersonii]|uniref:Transmembrane protein n=1 Tax=Solanum commersonii TaxID=4109 RepID=A0A9J5XZF1_SOLCO|nr:hypothetical protein H5410_043130 [Solanum commersonii]